MKRGLISALLLFNTFYAYGGDTKHESFKQEVKVLEERIKNIHDKKSNVHIKAELYVDYEVKEYYVWLKKNTSTKTVSNWYDEIESLQKKVHKEYADSFNICLEIAKVNEWQHEKAITVEELMQDLIFIPPNENQLILGFTGIKPKSISYVAGQADTSGNHLVIMTDKANAKQVYIHELGHMFQAQHIDEKTSIMYPYVLQGQKWDDQSKKIILENKNHSWKPEEHRTGLYELAKRWNEPDSIKKLKQTHVLFVLRDWKTGHKTLEELINKYPNEGHLYFLSGHGFSSEGKNKEAIKAYEKSILLGTEYPAMLNNLAYTYLEEGESYKRALELALKAVNKKPKEEAFIDTLGWAYYNNGKYPEAEKELLKITKYLDDDEYQFHLGMTYDKLNKKDKAKKALEKAIILTNNERIKIQAEEKLKEYEKL